MTWTAVLVAAAIQLLAAYRALCLIGPSRARLAWVLIAVAFCLLGLRLATEIFLVLAYGHRLNPLEEGINLLVAVLCLAGVQRIEAVFHTLNRTETEQKTAQEDLRRARDEAEAASRAKTEFLANMSHELRTPMTAIMGLLDLLQSGKLLPGDEYFGLARKAAERLLRLIEDLLDLATVEAGRMIYESSPFELRRCCEETAAGHLADAEAKGLKLAVEFASDTPRIFIGDQKRIMQVLRNLTENAIKFTEQGEVRIHIAPDAGGEPMTGGLRFSVRDSGVGVPAASRELVFDSFRQADGSATRRYGGVGLGLSLCKVLVEDMGGQIGMESEEGRGSLFYFVLPLSVAEKSCGSGST